ncbi:hypothetical protein ANOM_000770 [Aspergillus nomiae NRRL 13137]|uniref:Uncharacterized protein n=1 Tax=Aspergillus nomiae NRRL (strain ATCC 15546 / NRRL 13137 / CBS 260.88 / M93) TaxID=1509407 RepID=A0A0L1JH01_ASPN3|nr:uncharacterized protein ANOM_000770 [Aspergillus nomiae NRRL 13137]KNG91044.1 hypothetical protein ANOM_000770 [Aspergillus nomiae NRRL 13137]
MSSEATAQDINVVAEYLGDQQVQDLSSCPPVDGIVICASAILYQAEYLFQVLQERPSLSKCLVLCGGVGHSTHFLYEAVAQHPRFSQIAQEIHGLPEARVLERILDTFFDRSAITDGGCMILVEDQSTNCGLNASLSRKVLDAAGFQALQTCMIIQDPTMMLRTKASFQKAYGDRLSPPSFMSCPIIVPHMERSEGGELKYQELPLGNTWWPLGRFLELVMGEIPRLRDDESGYGPRGKGFIPHVEVPEHVEEAWSRLRVVSNACR